ncbi:MAG: hypothetical protein HYW86_01665 [Candidatus Roizmanbacteria bacterium]|nr:MAG: hypothetical protein HYW86_01665 [Candidatus Roizmanbacteria bacterium]
MKVNEQKLALVFAVISGGVRVIWSTLVALGWAKPLQDFVFQIHFLDNPFTIQPFDITNAVVAVVVATAVGYLVGWVVGMVWNKVYHKK